MKTADIFLLRVLIITVAVLFFHSFNYQGILHGLETIYIALARTIDPGYTLTFFAQNFLIWLAGISALWFVYR